MSQEGRMRK